MQNTSVMEQRVRTSAEAQWRNLAWFFATNIDEEFIRNYHEPYGSKKTGCAKPWGRPQARVSLTDQIKISLGLTLPKVAITKRGLESYHLVFSIANTSEDRSSQSCQIRAAPLPP